MNELHAIIGLGNPGARYEATRHNAGFWLLEALARECGVSLREQRKFLGNYAKTTLEGRDIHLLAPTTLMNHSGQSIGALCKFFKLSPEQLLVVHDELDLLPGVARFKQGGGHGGHNGLRDTISALGNSRDFHRLRLGIGHPGSAAQVVNYVLSAPGKAERRAIDEAIEASLEQLPLAVKGDWARAMNHLHSARD
ncbi:aminoacyl-tRNA hydrolase [Kushneria phosphatilytica]|uniref:Peptidyl-tRNA hydrolase n=1 Tax=Kushneria phosphatilytica TaxID=657387 RepID=A0A1S1NSR4_9GAMM|nr:aminoacyl-tRNA hydrolase [Kushneria phosphatilytica]OHV12289.1 aminoacyl-tRNA hydrolase [Kushneria phosphatilytica]QEL11493.1 aminoacyl-tRNA hydrolase [Kushneria phosphatilytica]